MGNTTKKCPKKGDLYVLAHQVGLDPKPFAHHLAVTVEPGEGTTSTDAHGIAEFLQLQGGKVCKVTPKLDAELAKRFFLVDASTRTVTIRANDRTLVNVDVRALVPVKVHVRWRDPAMSGVAADTYLDGVKVRLVTATPVEATTAAGAAGWADLGKLKPGNYSLTVVSLGNHGSVFTVVQTRQVTIPDGDTFELILPVEANGWIDWVVQRVVKDGTEGVPGIKIRAKWADNREEAFTTDSNGAVKLARLTKAPQKVEIECPPDEVLEFVSLESK